MIIYGLLIEKHGKILSLTSESFPTVKGYGKTEHEASTDFFAKLHNELNKLIKNGKELPASINPNKLPRKKGYGRFTIPLSIELTMQLHRTMLEKGIDRGTLAKLLALDEEEGNGQHWTLSKNLKKIPNSHPKYKKVQRLLDVKHSSTINEISDAFRVLDSMIDIRVIEAAN